MILFRCEVFEDAPSFCLATYQPGKRGSLVAYFSYQVEKLPHHNTQPINKTAFMEVRGDTEKNPQKPSVQQSY